MPADVLETISLLKKNYPNAKYYLNFSSPLELMVAAILSAQVRDTVVNARTPHVFSKYKTALDYASANLDELIRELQPITFAGNKAKNIKSACDILVKKYDGKVPGKMEALTELPGIGRKTANAILANGFGKVEGIPCDTHVIRVSFRLGWTKEKDPNKIEQDLIKIIPKKDWKSLPHVMKDHGRAICRAPVPYCSKCFLNKLCPKQGVTKKL